MSTASLQRALRDTGRYKGALDGKYGPLTRAAVLLAMTDGPDTVLTEADFADAAQQLGVTPAHIKAVTIVESSGAGFSEGRPVLLFEPHRFSRSTKGRYDQLVPDISYPKWDRSKYPKTQAARYDQLVKAVGLDAHAGFASASYGRFQILGENYAACGYDSPFEFAEAQAYDERTQLQSFVSFLRSKGLDRALRANSWAVFAEGYNGTAYRLNRYDEKLAAAFAEASRA